jgi:ATP-dependent protease HslVU (ClpYQ) peptidase subunit
MTTVVGYQGDGYVVMGCDSRIAAYDSDGTAVQMSTLDYSHSKIADSHGYLIGVAGDARAMNLLHHAYTPPDSSLMRTRAKLDAFITCQIIPSLRELFEEHGYASANRENKTAIEQDSQIMLAVNGRLVVIESDYGWSPDKHGIYAIGTGAAFALGAMKAHLEQRTMTVNKAKEAVLLALDVASNFDCHTGGPFKVFVQKGA